MHDGQPPPGLRACLRAVVAVVKFAPSSWHVALSFEASLVERIHANERLNCHSITGLQHTHA